jgi:hypothetical protein
MPRPNQDRLQPPKTAIVHPPLPSAAPAPRVIFGLPSWPHLAAFVSPKVVGEKGCKTAGSGIGQREAGLSRRSEHSRRPAIGGSMKTGELVEAGGSPFSRSLARLNAEKAFRLAKLEGYFSSLVGLAVWFWVVRPFWDEDLTPYLTQAFGAPVEGLAHLVALFATWSIVAGRCRKALVAPPVILGDEHARYAALPPGDRYINVKAELCRKPKLPSRWRLWLARLRDLH